MESMHTCHHEENRAVGAVANAEWGILPFDTNDTCQEGNSQLKGNNSIDDETLLITLFHQRFSTVHEKTGS